MRKWNLSHSTPQRLMTVTNAGTGRAFMNSAGRMAITSSAKCRKSSRSYVMICRDCSALLRSLSLNQNFNLAFDQPASVVDSEGEPVNFGHRRAVDDLIAPRRTAAVGYRHVHSEIAALALDRQRSCDAQHVSISTGSDARALKTNLRVRIGVQKILRAQMLITHFDPGLDARSVDCRFDRRALDVVFIERYLSAKAGETASDCEEQHLGSELHGRVLGVNRPYSNGAFRADCLYFHLTTPSFLSSPPSVPLGT